MNDDIFQEYLLHLESVLRQRPQTIYTAKVNVKYFLDWYGDRDLLQLSNRNILEYLVYMDRYEYIKNGKPKKFDEYTIATRKAQLRKFLTWLHEEYPRLHEESPRIPDLSKNIKLKSIKNKEPPSDLITFEEMEKMISKCENDRDRALISFLYHSGCRRGELQNIKIKDVSFSADLVRVNLLGKTGWRACFDMYSAHHLRQWMKSHPNSDDQSAPLFCSLRPPHGPISRTGLSEQLHHIAARSGIERRIYPHLFRHTRASDLATKLTEQEMKHFLGWDAASKMASVYVHLNAQDTENAVLKMHGLQPRDVVSDADKIVMCPRCHKRCPASVNWCDCGMPLSEDAVAEDEAIQHAQRAHERDQMSSYIDSVLTEKMIELEAKSKRLDEVLAIVSKNRKNDPTEEDIKNLPDWD